MKNFDETPFFQLIVNENGRVVECGMSTPSDTYSSESLRVDKPSGGGRIELVVGLRPILKFTRK